MALRPCATIGAPATEPQLPTVSGLNRPEGEVEGEAAMQATRLNWSRAMPSATPRRLVCGCRVAASKSAPVACLLCARAPCRRDSCAPTDLILEEIVVTGTRLRITAIETVAPVTVLSRRDIERGGADSIGKVLQTLPAVTGSPLNTNVNAHSLEPNTGGGSGDGSVRADLRGGSLTLLNGRRFPNGGIGADASVDLNTLPVSWIDRVEVLSGGAAAVYGSDAVGGVINIITRRTNEGVELNASRAITGRGDGEIVTGQAAVGFDALGGTWSVGVDYAHQDGVTLDRRSYSAVPMMFVDDAGTLGYAGNNATPEGRFVVPAGNALGLDPGTYTRVDGATGQTAADYRPFVQAVDGFNAAPYNYSQTPNERASLWLLGSLPLGQRSRFYMEGLLHKRTSEQQIAPEAIYGSNFLPALEDGTPILPADNYYNPFGVDLSPVGIPGPATRRFVEAGNRAVSEDIDLWRVLVGVEGAAGAWRWQVSAGDAASDATTVERGFFIRSRFVSALGPSGPDEAGHLVCGTPDAATGRVPASSIVPDCVPLNLFGGPGSITQDQVDHMSPRPLVNSGTNEQRIAELVFSGPWGQLTGLNVQWVLGAAYRREAGSFVQDPLHAEPVGSPVTGTAVPGGQYDVRELFAEVQLPLAHDRPWARDIVVDLGARWSDFSSFGQNTSWQAGLRWRVADPLTLRASYAEVFRAPSLAQLYQPRGDFGWFSIDPCGNDPTPEERQNCAANGVPDGAYVQGDGDLTVIEGGNPDLDPETGHTFGVGLVYTPAWAEGLSASLDYSHVVLHGFIGTVWVDDVVAGCAEHGSPKLCEAIHRIPNGTIVRVLTPNENLGLLDNSAFDVAIDWHATTRLGGVTSRLLATYLDQWDDQPIPGGEVFHSAGQSGLPRWRALGSVDWRSGPWTASYSAQYIGSYTEEVAPPFGNDVVVFDPYRRRVEAVLYHDVEAGFEFDSGLAVRAAITNVLDEDPPFVAGDSIANTDTATYRLLGRTYFLELRYRLQ